jgi:hypothetical protein
MEHNALDLSQAVTQLPFLQCGEWLCSQLILCKRLYTCFIFVFVRIGADRAVQFSPVLIMTLHWKTEFSCFIVKKVVPSKSSKDKVTLSIFGTETPKL